MLKGLLLVSLVLSQLAVADCDQIHVTGEFNVVEQFEGSPREVGSIQVNEINFPTKSHVEKQVEIIGENLQADSYAYLDLVGQAKLRTNSQGQCVLSYDVGNLPQVEAIVEPLGGVSSTDVLVRFDEVTTYQLNRPSPSRY